MTFTNDWSSLELNQEQELIENSSEFDFSSGWNDLDTSVLFLLQNFTSKSKFEVWDEVEDIKLMLF